MKEPEERTIPTRFISRKRFDLFRQLIEQHARKHLDEEDTLPAVYIHIQAPLRKYRKRRAYLVYDTKGKEAIDPVFRKRVIYRPFPEDEGQ